MAVWNARGSLRRRAEPHRPAATGGQERLSQRHEECGLCDLEKRAANGSDRRPARWSAVYLSRSPYTATAKTRDIAMTLHQSGNPQRDIGRLLRLSHQRVAQLLASRSDG